MVLAAGVSLGIALGGVVNLSSGFTIVAWVFVIWSGIRGTFWMNFFRHIHTLLHLRSRYLLQKHLPAHSFPLRIPRLYTRFPPLPVRWGPSWFHGSAFTIHLATPAPLLPAHSPSPPSRIPYLLLLLLVAGGGRCEGAGVPREDGGGAVVIRIAWQIPAPTRQLAAREW